MTTTVLGGLDTQHPHPARVYACWLGGGKDTFAADREAARDIARTAPWVVDGARASRAFLRRAVRYLATAGVSQFLDLGSGLPTAGNVHEIAQAVNPASRVCYVDLDPIVLVHARALLATDDRCIALAGDLRDPRSILTDPQVRAHLDLSRPVAVLMVAVLHFVRDAERPATILGTLREDLSPGSHLILSHAADLSRPDEEERAATTRQAAQAYRNRVGTFTLRTPEQLAALLDGWDLVPPGLVPAERWKATPRRAGHPAPVLAAVARRTPVDTGGEGGCRMGAV